MKRKYDVAAYIWPAYTGDEPRTRMFWKEGMGEWQSIKNSAPKENGYFFNRKPLWGYQNEADPRVMEWQINEATRHGVNVFIYDYYWYDNRPFLENGYEFSHIGNGWYGKGGMRGQMLAFNPSIGRAVAWHSFGDVPFEAMIYKTDGEGV